MTRRPFCLWYQYEKIFGSLYDSGCTHPVTGSLGDIFTDLLGGETKRTDLRGKGRRGTNLTTGGTEVAVNPRLDHHVEFAEFGGAE